MSYQEKTGPLMANSHPGSYCGQDAYSDMLVTERGRESMGNDNRTELCTDRRDESGNTVEGLQRPEHSVPGYIARRLTPTECARLQGFPPDWCSDVPHADSAEYKLWGNGIALPCLFNLFKAIADVYDAEAEEHEEPRLQSDTILTEEVRDASDK